MAMPSAAPMVLQQAASIKRTLEPAGTAARKAQVKKQCVENPWYCICRPVYPQRGVRHLPICPREIWTRNGGKAGGACPPKVGQVITCLSQAGPRAGKKFICEKVDKNGWRELKPDE